MRRVSLILLLVAVAAAEEPHAVLAGKFLDAHRAGDETRMSILAARPARDVAYTLAVYLLLERREGDAARKLADLRGGPERAGLKRLVETYYAGTRPDPVQLEAVEKARAHLARREGAAALLALGAAGEPLDGTLLAAEIHVTRARALELEGRPAEAATAYGDCADAAVAIGWLERARAATSRQLSLAPTLPAADRYVELNRLLDDSAALVDAYARKALVHDSLDELKEARASFDQAIHLAKQLRENGKAAALLARLAFLVHDREQRPKQALELYEEALVLHRAMKDRSPDAQKCLFNAARASTDVALYAKALDYLDELLGWNVDASLQGLVLIQRAYVLRRQGRLEKSRAAFHEALAGSSDEKERLGLHLELGELELLRFDLRAARRHFEEVLRAAPKDARALAGRAASRGDAAAARADFEAAVAAAPDRLRRRQILVQQAALERSWGRLDAAIEAAKKALEDIENAPEPEHGAIAIAYVVLADLLLVERSYEEASRILELASVLLHRLHQWGTAVPAYARETLVLIQRGERDAAEKRLATLRGMVAGVADDRLKAIAMRVAARFEAADGRPGKAIAFYNDAFDLAAKAGDVEGQATALVHRALLEPPEAAHAIVLQALDLLDGVPEEPRLPKPFVEGEHPLDACSIGVRSLADARKAYPLMERARMERLQLALRGREALLAATLPEELHRDYVAKRGRLREARVEADGVEEAERDYRDAVRRIREEFPRVAAIAFPEAPPLEAVQAALGEDEAFLLMLFDDYAKLILFVDRERAELKPLDATRPLETVLPLLEGKKRIIVAPDAVLALGPAAEGFDIRYVPSAALFSMMQEAGDGVFPVDRPFRLDLTYPQASTAPLGERFEGTLLLRDVEVRPGARPSIDGIAAVAAALWVGGAKGVVIPLHGKALPDDLSKPLPEGVVRWGAR